MLQTKTQNYLIFTDLDGTLLDHNTYSTDEAKEMLEKMEQVFFYLLMKILNK